MSKLTLAFKGKVLSVHYLQPGEIVIGSDPSCDIHIDSLAIQPRHASVTTAKHKSRLQDLSDEEGGTFVNDKKIGEACELQHDDEIRVGKHTLRFTTDPVDELGEDEYADEAQGSDYQTSKPAAKHAWLQILNGSNVGKTINLHRNLTNLGKSGVQTAVISRRGEGYFISHLEGQRTPLIDGKDIGENSHKLEDGNIIQIGNVKMQFTLV